ncbi:hypothetical protein B0H11DRAFT_2252083 [Mycena galericulata]|nr:hypothetical protein B0H11DRAFT_2252083 [Mycena galericulata]
MLRGPNSGIFYALTCGAEEGPYVYGSAEPAAPQMLPEAPSPASSTGRVVPLTRNFNGCGAHVHSRAHPDGGGSWFAATSGVDATVIFLDAEYFPPEVARLISKESCGCQISGVGCAVCGNCLGFLKTHCRFHDVMHGRGAPHSFYTFLPSAVSPPLPEAYHPAAPPSSPIGGPWNVPQRSLHAQGFGTRMASPPAPSPEWSESTLASETQLEDDESTFVTFTLPAGLHVDLPEHPPSNDGMADFGQGDISFAPVASFDLFDVDLP